MSDKKINADVTKEDYKGYALMVKVNTGKTCTDRFYGEAREKGVRKSNKVCSLHGNNRDDLLKQLKESIDNREIQISASQRQQTSPAVFVSCTTWGIAPAAAAADWLSSWQDTRDPRASTAALWRETSLDFEQCNKENKFIKIFLE